MFAMEQLKSLKLIPLCITITFFTSGVIINVFQLLLYFTVKPFNKTIFRRIMYYLCYSLYSQLIFINDWYANSTIRVYMNAEDEKKYGGKEHALLIMNHTYEIDWLFCWTLIEKNNVLGSSKGYVKKAISYMPGMGWSYKLSEFIILERSFDKDKEIIARQLNEALDNPNPTWLLLFAEGTRFTEKKHEASVKFAQERGMEVLKHHLIPRTKGFTASLPSLRGRCPAIYDINLVFKKDAPVAPTLWSQMKGQSVEGHVFIRRIPLEVVPEDEQKAAEWLQNLFREKDRIVESFHTTGSFFKTSGFKETAYKYYDRRVCTLVNFIVWALFSLSLVMYFLISCLLMQNWISLSIAVGILLTFYILMEKTIGMSMVNKASSYGAASKKGSE